MAKTWVGVDIGYDSIKVALVAGGRVKKTGLAPMPQNLLREGRAVSPESLGEVLRDTLKKAGISCRSGALVLPNESVYLRNVTMPRMSSENLKVNLPYEFRDYITEELKDYVFDYAMISTPEELRKPPEGDEEDPDNPGGSMEVMAVAAPLSLIEEYREVFRKAGLKLEKAAPTVCCYQGLIRQLSPEERSREFCILDLGYQNIRMYMFKGDVHEVTRVLEVGLAALDNAIAEAENVDVHLAHTYLLTNHENCQNSEVCRNTYNNIAVELMRALNFYRFSNPDSQLDQLVLCGGGAVIEPLRETIAQTLDLRIRWAAELVPGGQAVENCHAMAQAIGITLE